jgi:hypothetical protein
MKPPVMVRATVPPLPAIRDYAWQHGPTLVVLRGRSPSLAQIMTQEGGRELGDALARVAVRAGGATV